jgi:hypothetical protein
MFLHNLLNVVVQIAIKWDNKKSIKKATVGILEVASLIFNVTADLESYALVTGRVKHFHQAFYPMGTRGKAAGV